MSKLAARWQTGASSARRCGPISEAGWFVARRKDGSPVPVLVMDRGVYGAEGVLVGVVCVFTNISVALRPLLERSWDAAVVLGPDAVVRYASPAVEHLLGWTQAQLVGEEFTPLLHEEDRDTLLGALENLLAGDGGHRPVELRLRGGRGWMWCEVAVTDLLDDPALREVVCHVRPSRQRAARTCGGAGPAAADRAELAAGHQTGQGLPGRT